MFPVGRAFGRTVATALLGVLPSWGFVSNNLVGYRREKRRKEAHDERREREQQPKWERRHRSPVRLVATTCRALHSGHGAPGTPSQGSYECTSLARRLSSSVRANPQAPRYYEARPAHIVCEVTVFYSGALVETKALADFTKEYNGVQLLTTTG
jgi:hypothetical protein